MVNRVFFSNSMVKSVCLEGHLVEQKKILEDESENRAESSQQWFRFVHDGQLKMPLLPCKKIL